jgi:hypothetical protein
LERVYPGRNPTIAKILNLLAEEGEDLKLMLVPAHTGIESNEENAEKAIRIIRYLKNIGLYHEI